MLMCKASIYDGRSDVSDMLKFIQLALAFALELAMLAAFAYWGFHTGGSALARLLLGIGVPLLVAVIWGVFMAPKSTRRLQGAAYLAVKVVLFGLAAVALVAAGQSLAGIALAAIYLVSLRWNG